MSQYGSMGYSEKVMEHFRNPRNVGEIKDADAVGTAGNPVCVTPDTLICMNSNVISIEDATTGLKVLGHDGKYHRVEKTITTPRRGRMYRIVAHNLGSTVVTPDHHILALKASHILRKYRSREKCIKDWYTADELEKGDILLYPVPNETIDRRSIPFEIEKPKFDYKSKMLPSEVEVDGDFLRLVGYYLSEGYARTQRSKGTLGFVFGSKEVNYIDDVKFCVRRIFGLGATKVRSGGAVEVIFYSARLARFFSESFGKGAADKHLPQWMMLLPPEKQEALLCGLWRGDGYIRDQVAKYVTISKQLAFQVRNLLLRQGIIMSFLEQSAKNIHKKSYSIYVKDDKSLERLAEILSTKVKTPKKLKDHHKAWFEDGYFHVPIWQVEPLKYDGVVYNLEVQESHSYVSNSITLHNCGDLMTIYLKIKDSRIEDIKFMTFGCGAAIASSSMATELVKGKTLDEAAKLSKQAIADALDGLPPIKMHCSVLATEAIEAALNDYYSKHPPKS